MRARERARILDQRHSDVICGLDAIRSSLRRVETAARVERLAADSTTLALRMLQREGLVRVADGGLDLGDNAEQPVKQRLVGDDVPSHQSGVDDGVTELLAADGPVGQRDLADVVDLHDSSPSDGSGDSTVGDGRPGRDGSTAGDNARISNPFAAELTDAEVRRIERVFSHQPSAAAAPGAVRAQADPSHPASSADATRARRVGHQTSGDFSPEHPADQGDSAGTTKNPGAT